MTPAKRFGKGQTAASIGLKIRKAEYFLFLMRNRSNYVTMDAGGKWDMATIEQVKALMRMHFEGNNEKFKSISLQIAAHEAKIGHTASAREIKDLIQNPKYIAKP